MRRGTSLIDSLGALFVEERGFGTMDQALLLIVERLGCARAELRDPGADQPRFEAGVSRSGEASEQITLTGPGGLPAGQLHLFGSRSGDLDIASQALLGCAMAAWIGEELLLREQRRLARLNDLSHQISAQRDLGDLLHLGAEAVREVAGAAAVGLYLLEEDELHCQAAAGELPFPPELLLLGRGGQAMLGHPHAQPIELAATRLDGWPAHVQLLRQSALRVRGALLIRFEEGGGLDSADRTALEALSTHLSDALQRISLLHATQHLVAVDELTGVFSRRHFLGELGREIERARREQRDLCLLMLDADHFKAVNDQYGHAAGDVVLQALGQGLKQGTRTLDVVGRLGGEEFAILLPGADKETGLMVAERLHRGPARIEAGWRGVTLRVTVSIGLAVWESGLDGAALLEEADLALYAAKEQGRDRVVCRDPRDDPSPRETGATGRGAPGAT